MSRLFDVGPMSRHLRSGGGQSITTEEELSCALKACPEVGHFATSVLFAAVRTAKKVGLTDAALQKVIVEEVRRGVVTKPGFDAATAAKIVKADTSFLVQGFHQAMGAWYPLVYNPTFVLGCIEGSPVLREEVLRRIRTLFCLPDHLEWDSVKPLIKTNTDLAISALAHSAADPRSLYRRNIHNTPSIRDKVVACEPMRTRSVRGTCHADMGGPEHQEIMLGSSCYVVDEGSFFAGIMMQFGRPYLSGPSGSAVLSHLLVFSLLGIERTPEREVLLLACLIADYVPYHHTLTEILMTYSFEMTSGLSAPYMLDMDPVEYAKRLIQLYTNLKLDGPRKMQASTGTNTATSRPTRNSDVSVSRAYT